MPDESHLEHIQYGVYRSGLVELDEYVDWPDGTCVVVSPAKLVVKPDRPDGAGGVIVAGFGLAGRAVADLLEQGGIAYVIVERNLATIETQTQLGRKAVEGDVAEAETLLAAGIKGAAILALTIPDEEAVLRAVLIARNLNPDVFIIARTTYASRGIRATKLGADEVVKSEQAVALQFYNRMKKRLERATPGG